MGRVLELYSEIFVFEMFQKCGVLMGYEKTSGGT